MSTRHPQGPFSVRYRRGALVNGRHGVDWEISDGRGFVVRGGWTPGNKDTAKIDAEAEIARLLNPQPETQETAS